MSWLQIKKNEHFEVLSSSYCMQQQQTISWSDCDLWWKVTTVITTWKLVMIDSVVGPRRNSKSLPKFKLAPKEGHGHCLVVCCPSDPLQLSEPRQNHYIWEVCSANQWDALKPVSRMGVVLLHDNINRMLHNQCFKNWTTKFWLIHCIQLTTCQPTTTPSTISTTFCRGKYFHNQQEAENAFQEFLEFCSTDFYATWINYFLLAKICWL